MQFEWDDDKNVSNKRKHGVDFETALLAFDDPDQIQQLERVEDGEERWWTIGRAQGRTLLLVVHLIRDDDGDEIVRIISAREPTRWERRLYEDQI